MSLLLLTILCTQTGGDAVKEFHVLAEEYIRGFYAFHPSWATFAGIHDHDGDLDDWSPEAMEGEIRLAQLADALLRLCRYRVALGLHAEGMTIEEAQGFFEEQGFLSPYAARREAVRGTFNPLYLSYALGKLQILKLREDYRKKMGEAYTPREFHDRFLAAGEAPIAIIRESLLHN